MSADIRAPGDGETATCKHCLNPIVHCDSVPPHAGCASAHGWFHFNLDQWSHSCRPQAGRLYAQPAPPALPSPLRPAHAAPPLSDEDAAVIRAWFPLAASPAAAEAGEAA